MKAERETAAAQADGTTTVSSAAAWFRDLGAAIKANWFLFVYMVVLMTGFNSCSHGSQDLYPTFLKNRK
jgi:MFS transporter, SHS family, lactate transporter